MYALFANWYCIVIEYTTNLGTNSTIKPHWMTFHQSSYNDVAVPTNPIISSQSNPTKKEVVDLLGP